MAGQYLASQGIDIDSLMSSVQFGGQDNNPPPVTSPPTQTSNPPNPQLYPRVDTILNASLPQTPQGSLWDIAILDGKIRSTSKHDSSRLTTSLPPHIVNAHKALLAPSLCHPHIHLDKPFLLSHPSFSHLQIERGDFSEAMDLTNKAKSSFTLPDLLERGQRLIDESISAGVTHMRAFVEVDPIVSTTCLSAGIALQSSNAQSCQIQLCAFAQLALFSTHSDGGKEMRTLLDTAINHHEVDVVGSTPYVEDSVESQKRNIEYMIDLALQHDKHLDFHLDYHLDPATEPLIWFVLSSLKAKDWVARTKKGVVLGHCTRLTHFSDAEWCRLANEIHEANLPVSFVGLPTSDLFMMRTESGARGTLPIPRMVREFGLNAAVGINNVGNAFTPQGCCDPVSLASLGVGVYQAGTVAEAECLFECVSVRAKAAIGLGGPGEGEKENVSLKVEEGKEADLVLFGHEDVEWRTRRMVSEAVYLYDGGRGRRVLKGGMLVG